VRVGIAAEQAKREGHFACPRACAASRAAAGKWCSLSRRAPVSARYRRRGETSRSAAKLSESRRQFWAPAMEPAFPRAGKRVALALSCRPGRAEVPFLSAAIMPSAGINTSAPFFSARTVIWFWSQILGRDHRESRHAFRKLDRCGRRHGGTDGGK
jgi:hypothetical protein